MDYGDLSHEARELVLWIENDQRLANQEGYIKASLDKKKAYEPSRGVKAFEYLTTAAAKDYVKGMGGGEWSRTFSPATRREAASFIEHHYRQERKPVATKVRVRR